MDAADRGLTQPPPVRRRALAAIQQKLERLLRSSRNPAIDPYRVEVGSILETLASLNRETVGMRKGGSLGRLGDFELD